MCVCRHAAALNTTLQRVHSKVEDGYQQLNARIEALDFDVEKAAEDELDRAGGSVHNVNEANAGDGGGFQTHMAGGLED